MKKVYNILGIILSIALLWSCSSDFIDKDPKTSISNEKALSTYDKLVLATNGLYAPLLDRSLYGESSILAPDVMADNVVLSSVKASGRYIQEFNLTMGSNDGPSDGVYSMGYYIICAACNVINAIEANKFDRQGATDAQVNQLLGEALFIRAMVHFDLCRWFAYPYHFTDTKLAPGADGAGGHPGIPVVLTTEIGKPARSTVHKVYEQVISDLKRAADLMTEKKVCFWASSEVAKALLARVYLYQGNNQDAATMATEVIGSHRYELTPAADFVKYWALEGQKETIFELQSNKTDDYFYGGNNNPGGVYLYYGDLVAANELATSYEEGDVRAKLVVLNKDGEYTVNKYPGREGTGNVEINNPHILRLAEMYLIRAEANQKNNSQIGDTPLNDVNAVRAKRGLPGLRVVDGSTIASERRKELAFEGHRWFDLSRNGQDNVRPGCKATPLVTWPDKRFVLPIPLYEMKNNGNMVQNIGY